jgi:hypothetical protein
MTKPQQNSYPFYAAKLNPQNPAINYKKLDGSFIQKPNTLPQTFTPTMSSKPTNYQFEYKPTTIANSRPNLSNNLINAPPPYRKS